jgi:hypothetical protein
MAVGACEPFMEAKPRKSSVHVRIDHELADLIDQDAQRLRLSLSEVRQALLERFERKERGCRMNIRSGLRG